jgi:hypothetical protein
MIIPTTTRTTIGIMDVRAIMIGRSVGKVEEIPIVS